MATAEGFIGFFSLSFFFSLFSFLIVATLFRLFEGGDSCFFSRRRGERSSSGSSSASLPLSAARGPSSLSAARRVPLEEERERETKERNKEAFALFSPLLHSSTPPPLFLLLSSPPFIMAASDEDLPLLTKPASLQTPTKALLPGTLSIARMRGSWLPQDANSAAPLHFAYRTLTGALQRAKGKPMLRLPLPTGPRVIVFESVEDTDQVVDLLTPLIARAQQQGGGDGSGAAAGAGGAPSSSAAAAASRQPAKADAWSHAKRKLLEEDKCVLLSFFLSRVFQRAGVEALFSFSFDLSKIPSFLPSFGATRSPSLLRTHRDLKAVYDQLVGGGALTEGEFWRGRADKLSAAKNEMAAASAAAAAAATKPSSSSAKGIAAAAPPSSAFPPPGQRVGLASALLVEEASSSRSGGANRATFRLTPELVLQIFAERPYVRAAYASAVPRACGEAEFWKRYLRYEAVRRARRRLKSAGRDPGEAGPEDELFRQFRAERRAEAFGATATMAGGREAAQQNRPGEESQHRRRHHHPHVDPGVDLEADAADNAPPGYGLAHAGARDPSVGGGSAARPRSAATAAAAAERDAIVHELNRHAAVVLAGVPMGLPSDAGAAARALKEGPNAAAAAGAAAETDTNTSPAAVAAAKGAKATAAAASAARDREETERWRDRAGAGLDDLNPAPQEEFEALTVADPRGYFGCGEEGKEDGAAAPDPSCSNSSKSSSPEAIVASLRAPVKKKHTALAFDAFSLFQPQDAVRALRDLALAAAAGEETVSADDLMLAAATGGGGGGAGSLSAAAALAADPAALLPPPLLALLRQAALTANELLRHFWSSANSEASSSSAAGAAAAAAAAARSARVVKALGTQYDRIQAMQGAASSGSERAAVRRLLAPVAAAIDVAIERAAEMERKAGGGGGAGAVAIPMETN